MDKRPLNMLWSVWKDDRKDPRFSACAGVLAESGHTFYASGGTADDLKALGIRVVDIGTIVGKAILGHKVVTLSREVHGGLVASYDVDLEEMEKLGLPYIDMLVGKLYPLTSVIASGAAHDKVIEATDLGGIALLRSAAKGRRMIASDLGDLQRIIWWLEDRTLPKTITNMDSVIVRERMAAKAERIAELYCRASADYIERTGRPIAEARGFSWDTLLGPIEL